MTLAADANWEQTKTGRLLALAEEEADCVLRVTTRRAVHSSASMRPAPKGSMSKGNARQKAQDTSQKAAEQSTPHANHLQTELCSDDEHVAFAGQNGSQQSRACHTPAPSRHVRQVADDVEESDTDFAPTPVLPMTVRRKGRFSAMQSSEVIVTKTCR
jgi:hypothetical protein